jgi:eukaryotic-like serine/threonine-protein kinase
LSSLTDQVGRVLAGRYRLVAQVGTGASAHVYAADDVVLSRRVAVKVLHPALVGDYAFLQRFRAEARAVASLNHPHVMRVFDWGEDADGPFLVLEHLGGGSLRDLLDAGHLLTPSQAAWVGAQAAHGLAYAHRRGIVHRDVKPANILFDEEGSLRVGDFGLARALAEAAWTEPIGAVLGTARYASPEQAEGKLVTDRADVYSLALVLFESITGWVPFSADTTVATLMARLGARLPMVPDLGLLGPILAQAAIPQPLARLDAAGLAVELEIVARDLDPPAPLPLAGPGHRPGRPERDPTLVGEQPRTERRQAVQGTLEERTGPVPAQAAPAPSHRLPAAPRVPRRPSTPPPPAPPQAHPEPPPPAYRPLPPAIPVPQPARPQSEPEPKHRRAPVATERRPAPARPPRRPLVGRRTVLLSAAILLVVAVLLLVAAAASLVSYRQSVGAGHVVPPFARQTVADARKSASALDLRLAVGKSLYDSTVPTGEVINQSIQAGSHVAGGTIVWVEVSEGAAPVPVPSLLDDTPQAAEAALHGVGLVPAQGPAGYSETVPSGEVYSWSSAGLSLRPGSTVTFDLSKGPPLRLIPSFTGETWAQASAELDGQLLVPTEQHAYSSTVSAGYVIKTVPAAGQLVPRGSGVTVVVSKGPQYVTLDPDIVGMTESQARSELASEGLTLAGTEGFGQTVIDTVPSPGSSVQVGTPVWLYLF